MSASVWEPIQLDDERLTVRATCSCTAYELLRELLVSKQATSRVFSRNQLTFGDRVLDRSAQLEPGDELSLTFARHKLGPQAPGAVTAVYRDPLLMAVDKPAGLLVHGDGSGAPTLTSCVQGLLAREGSHAVAQAVQRLDVETTGLVLFSLTDEFQPALDAQVAGHDMRKRYLAAIEGRLPQLARDDEGWSLIELPLGRDRHDARRMRVARAGKPACTRVRELMHARGRSVLLVELLTGRRHQIRVHLAHVGRPLVGDTLYGGCRSHKGLMLHAWQERVTHPVWGSELTLATGLPDRFARCFPGIEEACANA